MSTDKHVPPCPRCGSDYSAPNVGFYTQYGRFHCIDCGANFGDMSLLYWHIDAYGVQVYAHADRGHKWIQQSSRCPECGHTWQAIAPLDSTGIECPLCHTCNMTFVWKLRD